MEMLDLSDSEDDFLDEIDEEIDFDLEEGEFLPPDDWTSVTTDVSEFGQDMGVDPDADVDEHHVSPSRTEFVVEDDQGQRIVDIDEDIDDSTDSSDFEDLPDKLKDNPMFKPLERKKKKRIGISEVDITGKREVRKGIIGWYFDSDLKLFAIKRFDGVQYFEKKLSVFSSLPRYEIYDLARLPLKNPSDDTYARYVEHVIKTEGCSRKFEKIKPRVGKTIKLNERSQRTGRRRRRKVYPAVKCVKQIPLKTMPQDILGNMKSWGVDSETGEAVMVEADDEVEGGEREIFRVYDHRHLMNMSKKDLLKLNENRIFTTVAWGALARNYQMMVKTCIKMKIYAGSKIYK